MIEARLATTTYSQYLASWESFQQAVGLDVPGSQAGLWGAPSFVVDKDNNGTAVYFFAERGGLTKRAHADRLQ